ncbi:MAG: TonB-dependent receptor [Chitinophagales bacterium]|nr:TonB-dependent receptor [Chitinophagales bacterium]
MRKKNREIIPIKKKALTVNLDSTIYGTLAEIGAGQEVARNFFRVGAASGTIAKSMSAYDMAFSDNIYGEEEDGRYVSESRLMKMLDHEYSLLTERLVGEKSDNSKFFAFANTVTTLNYEKTNQPHGWVGLRFQAEPNGAPNDIIFHIRVHDNNAILQQRVLGEIGINLIYGAYYHQDDAETLVESLQDNLSTNHLEVDMIRISGPSFSDLDNRLLGMLLVKMGFTNATIFGPNRMMYQAKDFLYKKNIMVIRGRYRPMTLLNEDMLENGKKSFIQDGVNKNDFTVLSEMTLSNLYKGAEDQSRKDFLDRAEILCSLGHNVMVSNFHEHHKLVEYLAECKTKKIGIVIGILNLLKIYGLSNNEDHSKKVLNSFGQLFAHDVTMYAYPYQRYKNGEIISAKNLQTYPEIEHLHQHFISNGYIKDICEFDEDKLQIFSDEIIQQIKAGKDDWVDKVPEKVAFLIKKNCLFDYPCEWVPPSKDFSFE